MKSQSVSTHPTVRLSVVRFLRIVVSHLLVVLFAIAMIAPGRSAFSNPEVETGRYHIQLSSSPAKLAVGKSLLYFTLTDKSGVPVNGASLHVFTQMPGMNMGEVEVIATAIPTKPGVYQATARLAMDGAYNCRLRIDGPLGATSLTIPISTGEDLGVPGQVVRHGVWDFKRLLAVAVVMIVAILLVLRLRASGQGLSVKRILQRSVIMSVLMLAAIIAIAYYSVTRFRRPGAMTPMEAQGMQMDLPPPPGAAPVTIEVASLGPIEGTIDCSGQVGGRSDLEINSRIEGNLVWMPFYSGDHITKGQVVARLDTTQSVPQAEAQRAGVRIAEQGVSVARKEYQQALAAITEAHAEVGMKQGALDGAQAALNAAREEHAGAEADLQATESMKADAQAQISGAGADATYWSSEIERETKLLNAGAVTREEYQRELSQERASAARYVQATARNMQVEAQIRSAQAAVRKTEAIIEGAKAHVKEAQAELDSHFSHVSSSQTIADSAKQKIAQATAVVEQARAFAVQANATEDYSTVRSPITGVVTERIVSPGVLVSPGQPIMRVSELASVRLQANVPQSDLPRVHPGSPVVAFTHTGAEIHTSISSVAPLVDPVSRTAVVESVVRNADLQWISGESVRLVITTQSKQHATLISTAAVIRLNHSPNSVSSTSRADVWIAKPSESGEFSAHELEITIGISNAHLTEVTSGVQPGDRVILSGQEYLKEGDSVSFKEVSR